MGAHYAFIGILTAIVVVYLERIYQAQGVRVATTMGFATFALLSVVMGISARSETATAFNRDILRTATQLILYGMALVMAVLSTEWGSCSASWVSRRSTRNQWLTCIGVGHRACCSSKR